MKDHVQELVDQSRTRTEATLMVREYLQARVLQALQQAGAFESWAFLGGTALRFLYRLPRFSEDLDFSRTGTAPSREAQLRVFNRLVSHVQRLFEAEAYQIEVKNRPNTVVQSAFFGFPGLLSELGLSPHSSQKLSIKIEIDTNPPEHAVMKTSIVRRHVLLNLLHYDKTSLFAGKLHALLQRSHVKGRDVYDLMWYLSDPTWPEPNLRLLQASLAQTGMTLTYEQTGQWRSLVSDRIADMDWDRVVEDVAPFLEQPEEIGLLTRENLLNLLSP